MLSFDKAPYQGDVDWMIEQIRKLPDKRVFLKISEWAAKNRYLSSEVTTSPGQWSNRHAPYTVEIMDCFSTESPIRDVVWMKASQMAATTAVLENWIGYTMDHAPAPMLYLTGSEELVKTGIEIYLDSMIASVPGLSEKIRSTHKKGRKTGNLTGRKEFRGGFLLTYGAQSTSKLRRVSVQNLAIDEVDEIPSFLGKQGDPLSLARARQKGFDAKRKTLYLSTPTTTDGAIYRLFKVGDQRYYFVPCRHCGMMQILEFRGRTEDGKRYGIHYELDRDNVLIYESVEYRCKNCLAGWKNFEKYDFLNAGEWRPTKTPRRRLFRSYHSDGLYSPEGNYSWESMVEEWLGCWDPKQLRIFDVEALRVFQNTGRGLPYEERGEAPAFEVIIHHRRGIYRRNEIPNIAALKETGSPVLVVTAGVDVHKNWIGIEIKGWCKRLCSYSIDWRVLEGPTDISNSPSWEALREIIENEIWAADDGKKYKISLTLIDASYRTTEVYDFCREYEQGVFAIMGRDMPPNTARMSEFSAYTSKGLTAYNITVTQYKDKLASYLRSDWNEGELQPKGYPNFPENYGDDFFRQYEAEHKVSKIRRVDGKRMGHFWKEKKKGAPNHTWDCGIYNGAGLDMLCHNTNLVYLNQDRIDYKAFWDYISENKTFYWE